MMATVGKRVCAGLFFAVCLAGSTPSVWAQGIATTPKPPTRPAATQPAVKQDEQPSETKSTGTASDKQGDGAQPANSTPPPSSDPKPASAASKTIKIDIHGGAWLFYWQPIGVSTDPIAKVRGVPNIPDEGAFFRMHVAHLNFDGSIGNFGLFFNASVRDTRMREYYDGTAWIEEGYAYYKHRYATIKVGKTYSRFGLFWDNSFYGNTHFFDGIKLDPNYGVSIEGSVGKEKGFRLGYYGQYFIVDGRTNGSYIRRDTVSIPGARKRHMVVVRAEPSYFWNKNDSLTLGLSGSYFQADIPNPIGKQNVFRAAIDLYATVGPFSIWGDISRQMGQSVTEWPIPPTVDPATGTITAPGQASATNDYVLVGGEARLKKFVARYNFSAVRYQDVSITEFFHVPGIGYNMNDNLQFLVEFVYWYQQYADRPEVALFDRTFATTIHGYF
ncbi:MAG: hypothetical protein IPM54_24250 [Polyangiaceae bacterium]|nr:hypothetical protein [Polyangiaceae bacterium]